MITEKDILYEDNHIIIVNKKNNQIVQGDKTGDKPLVDLIKDFLKEKYNKPGNVFCGVVHRLDRPVSGAVMFAKTSKALSRLNQMFKDKDIEKVYWAIVKNRPPKTEDTLTHYISRNTKQNKSYALDNQKYNSKVAILTYKLISSTDKYFLLEINLKTGRHHQIRAQLTKIGCPIRGDKKYGFKRPNKNYGIDLHARQISFYHPVSGNFISISAPVPDDVLWNEIVK